MIYEIGSRIPQTLFLMVTALSLAVVIGVPIGVVTAVKQYSRFDYGLNALAIFLASTPVFVLGLRVHLCLRRQPPLSCRRAGMHTSGRNDVADTLYHLILPGDGARDRQRGAAGALHAGEHARRAEQRVRHDGAHRRGSATAGRSCGTPCATG